MQSSAMVEDVDAFCRGFLDSYVECEQAVVARSLYGVLGYAKCLSVYKNSRQLS